MSARNVADCTYPLSGDGSEFLGTPIERLLVFGDFIGDTLAVRYPSYPDLAQRFGLSATRVARFSRRYDCLKRRAWVQRRIQAWIDEETRFDRQRGVHLRLLDAYLVAFATALAEGSVPTNHPKHAIEMIQLRSLLRGEMNDDQQVIPCPDLRQLQDTYRRILEQLRPSHVI